MNKELIKKYKAEFDHWLHGGKLLGRFNFTNIKNYKPEPWFEFEDTKWSLTSFEYLSIIIEDEYVEFRKALAEGKTVQYNPITQYHNRWDEIKSINPSKRDSIKNYRVKPEELQFKVGDWLINEKPHYNFGKEPSKPFIVTQDWIDHINKFGKTCGGNTAQTGPLENFKHWEPKPGEYIWDKHYGFCKVTTNCVTNEVTTLFNCIDPFNKALEFTVLLEDCQPFIGTLPTNLQD